MYLVYISNPGSTFGFEAVAIFNTPDSAKTWMARQGRTDLKVAVVKYGPLVYQIQIQE